MPLGTGEVGRESVWGQDMGQGYEEGHQELTERVRSLGTPGALGRSQLSEGPGDPWAPRLLSPMVGKRQELLAVTRNAKFWLEGNTCWPGKALGPLQSQRRESTRGYRWGGALRGGVPGRPCLGSVMD